MCFGVLIHSVLCYHNVCVLWVQDVFACYVIIICMYLSYVAILCQCITWPQHVLCYMAIRCVCTLCD